MALNSLPVQASSTSSTRSTARSRSKRPRRNLGDWAGLVARLANLAERLGWRSIPSTAPSSLRQPPETIAAQRVVSSAGAAIADIEAVRELIDDLAPWAGVLNEMPGVVPSGRVRFAYSTR